MDLLNKQDCWTFFFFFFILLFFFFLPRDTVKKLLTPGHQKQESFRISTVTHFRGEKTGPEKLSNLSKLVKLKFESIRIWFQSPYSFYCPILFSACQTTNQLWQRQGQTWSLPQGLIHKCSQVCHGCYTDPEGIILLTPIIYNLPGTSILFPQLIFSVWLMVYTKFSSKEKDNTLHKITLLVMYGGMMSIRARLWWGLDMGCEKSSNEGGPLKENWWSFILTKKNPSDCKNASGNSQIRMTRIRHDVRRYSK